MWMIEKASGDTAYSSAEKNSFSLFLNSYSLRAVISLTALLFLASASPKNISAADTTIIIKSVFPHPVITRENGYDRVTMPDLQNIGKTGEPVLPFKTLEVLIPYGAHAVGVTCEEGAEAGIRGDYLVEPGQHPYPLNYEGEMTPATPNEKTYSSTTRYPAVSQETISEQCKYGYRILLVNLYPVKYIPSQKKISYFRTLTIRVQLGDGVQANGMLPMRASASDREAVRAMANNPEAIDSYPVQNRSNADTYKYVIITTEALKNASGQYTFQSLADHRTARGMPATIVTVEWIYATYPGADSQTKIRNFIIDAYQNWGTEYVLLGGVDNGTNKVPARKFWVQSWVGGYTDNIPADMYYGCLDGDFNHDGDNNYGEPNDGPGGGEVDLYAEVAVGRAAVDSSDEVNNFVRKTIAYENSSDDYLRHPSMVGEYLGFGGDADYATASMEEIRLGSSAHDYTTHGFAESSYFDTGTLYDSPTFTWSKSQLIGLMNSGTHIFNHLGHANYTYDMKLYTSDLSSLTNDKYFFAYSQGCMPGGFDTVDCFAETITSMAKGAFAVVMNARYGWGANNSTSGPSQYYDREFWDALFGEGTYELGWMNADSKEDNVGRINGECMRWCCYELNLFGDPAVKIKSLSSAGVMSLDKSSYTIPATIAITVIDKDLDTDPQAKDTATVTVTSTTEAEAETVTLEETGISTKTFTGTIAAVSGSPAHDGKIQVAHGDTITVTYNDADNGAGQPRTVTATATADSCGPVISGVASDPASTNCVITWTTDELGTSAVHYGTSPSLGETKSSRDLTTSHSIKLTGLSAEALHYFDVSSTDSAGNGTTSNNGGAHYQFTTLEVSPILFVDDDVGDTYETYFTQALDAGGYSYDTWDISTLGASPTAGDLAAYTKVIWNCGYEWSSPESGLTDAEEAAIRGYLDGGGRLFLSGQDILYNGVTAAFRSGYLHLGSSLSDDQTASAHGVGSDPISDGVQLDLSYLFSNWSDSLTPGASAAGVFLTDGTTTYDYCAVRYPKSGSATFRIVFFAFPFEAICGCWSSVTDPNDRAWNRWRPGAARRTGWSLPEILRARRLWHT